MKCAGTNDERMIQQRMRARRKFVDKMTMLFEAADNTGDGSISREEFVKILTNERVQLWLQAMDFHIRDPEAFFAMIDTQGDGDVDAQELITGMAQLCGPSTQIFMKMSQDKVLHELTGLRHALYDLQN